MIKLFRNIRQSLLAEGKTTKYFKYAIGEIILVVIGILIALSINTWNDARKDKNEARFQLSKLKDNLTSDREQLIKNIATDSFYAAQLIFCLKVLSNQTETTMPEFQEHFQEMKSTISFDPIRGTFESLISSGKIELINNQKLLDALFSYYNNPYIQWDASLKEYTRNIMVPYLLNFDHITNTTSFNETWEFTQFDISKFEVPIKTIEDYKRNLFIINAVRFKITLFEGQQATYFRLLKEIDALVESIAMELKK